MLIIAGHATRSDGFIHEFPNILLIEDLMKEKKSFFYIRHSIDGRYFSQLFFYSKGIQKYMVILPTIPFPSILRYSSELFFNVIISMLISTINLKRVIFIGIDPLNALGGILLKKIRFAKITIFYSVDFSNTRFKNKLLNSIYLSIDSLSARKSTQVWNVSKRIFKLREQQKISPEKNKLVPNVPVSTIKKIKNKKTKDEHRLITLGILNNQLDFKNLIYAINSITNKGKNVSLAIVGTGPEKVYLQNLVTELNLDKHVFFLGYLEHKKALEEIAKSDIGLALYNGSWSFNYYGDSLKCREFFSIGLPVISTNTHSTVEDITEYKAGIIVKQTIDDYVSAIENIIQNYQYYSKNSKLLAQKYSNIRINLLQDIL